MVEKSKADEMFEKLGYTKNLAHKAFADKSGNLIIFHHDKTISFKTCNNNGVIVSLEELQAINEKVKELDWNDTIEILEDKETTVEECHINISCSELDHNLRDMQSYINNILLPEINKIKELGRNE